jgi:hypothetical protein
VKIGDYIMQYFRYGEVGQIGMGGLGAQRTKLLLDIKLITGYPEIAVDSMIPLVECGAVKKVVTAGVFGTQAIYDFISSHPCVECRT